ncbi:TetR/AcrR family transcriptional regulator C-terminal domain-containing protein [Actinomycetospora termitidis]|uniref:TetR/AcrR family transcriptional regulator C-terminal domain-containing protein n=1 Tax=Actinomycetospora termitidis TaxID=3053470 RepID=A0ABT7M7T5_9PSEU|nr:TetR/AcrR family transcriptional regulator C-terminal domain-containing protein [Actinomycetospora sp. Odt1-22]MDL5156254.1 TetR/AcrR family transcriptional regulator C-terminal domain-containing protein [Actinomycetospora sp. Odt1-22]
MAISRDAIVTAAVRLLDEGGLAALSLRKVAAELGVSAPTLYWHVTDKRALLDLVAERMVAEHAPPEAPAPGQPWWEWLAESARVRYRAFTAHRDAALVVAGNRPTTASLDQIERTLAVLVDAGFTPSEAMDAVFGLGHYVLGAALEYHAEAARSATPPDPDVLARLAELPTLHAAATSRTDATGEATFETGLATMIRGLRATRS